MTQRSPSWRRAAAFAAALPCLLFLVNCDSERSTGPEPAGGLAEISVSANVQSTTVATLVIRVTGADIQPALVFNLTAQNGAANGTIKIPAGSARTISAQAFDDAGIETHRGAKTVDIRPGANNPPLSITLLPIAGDQPLELRLGTLTITITQVPASLRVAESATLSVTVTGSDGSIVPVSPADIRWASATPWTLAVDQGGVVTGVAPGEGKVAVTYAGTAGLATITLTPRLGFYASPTGAATGNGSWEQPWDLATALSGAGGLIQAGHVVWLRAGVYAGDFTSSLTGSPTAQIIVRQYPGERATIEGRLRADGAHTTYWGFEIRQADPMTPSGPPALEAYAPGAKYVNLIIHDAGENGISFRTPEGVSEIHGCILYNNGNTQELDHGIYASSEAAVLEKLISDNVLFNNIASGIQVFGDETHPTIANVTVVGNISFNNSSIAVDDPSAIPIKVRGGEENIVVGGDNNVVENITVRDNLLYFSPGVSAGNNLVAGLERELTDPPIRNVSVTVRNNFVVGGNTLFSLQEWEQATVDGNTFVAPNKEHVVRFNTNRLGSLTGVLWTGNTQYRDPAAKAWRYGGVLRTWQEFRDSTELGASDQVIATPLTATKILLRPNKYEEGRAHIAIYSPMGEANVVVDVSQAKHPDGTPILKAGDRYEVRNVQNVFGPPVVSGTYSGQPLALPMTAVTPPPAAGRGPAPVTGPYFNAFLLTRALP